ncbi:MAG: YezD family protein [Kiritimatiellia bacterium]
MAGLCGFLYHVRRLDCRVHGLSRRKIIRIGNVSMENAQHDGKIDKRVLDEILLFIRQINYGEVTITIHDSKIVQIEKREKKRFHK